MANRVKRITLSVTALACSLSANSSLAFAEESTVCPDMSQHQKVLNDGLKQSESGTTRTHERSHYSTDLLMTAPVDEGLQPLPEADIDKLPLEKDYDVNTAELYALMYESVDRYESAKNVYERILLVREKGSDKNALASTLEDLARVYIMLGSPSSVSTKNDFRRFSRWWQYARIAAEANARGTLINALQPKDKVEAGNAADRSSHFDRNWEMAVKLYGRGLELDGNGQLNMSSLLNLAALKEWQGEDPWTLYTKGMSSQQQDDLKYTEDTPTVAAYGGWYGNNGYEHRYVHSGSETEALVAAVYYCIRNNRFDRLASLESKLLSSELWASVSSTILAYLHHNRGEDALRLFRQALAKISISAPDHERATSFLSSEVMVVMIPRLSESDIALLCKCIVDGARLEVLPEVIATMEKRGWNDQAMSLYQAMEGHASSHTKVLCSLEIAGSYRSRNNYPKYFKTINQAVDTIETANDLQLGPRYALMQAVEDALPKQSANQFPEAQIVMAKANNLCELYRRRIQKHECLQIADTLDKTGDTLEHQGQYSQAEKMYRESLAIKERNLDQGDPVITSALDNVARICAEQKRYTDAQNFYEQELLRYKKNPSQQDREYAAMLERYGDMLAHAKQTARADQIYAEARAFYRR
jgi:tetratricopeptide (TPR) repeat protein